MVRLIVPLAGLVGLIGCGSDGPYYSTHENGLYGYAQVDGPLFEVRYLGKEGNEFVFEQINNPWSTFIHRCADPCQWREVVEFINGVPTARQRYANQPGTVGWEMFEDARLAHLKVE